MKRSRKNQTKHDAKVLSMAKKLKRQGFDVKAAVRGYEQLQEKRKQWIH